MHFEWWLPASCLQASPQLIQVTKLDLSAFWKNFQANTRQIIWLAVTIQKSLFHFFAHFWM